LGASSRARTARNFGLAAAIFGFPAADALAFPLIDPSNQTTVPTGTELSTPDVQDLQHQLQLVNGPIVAPPGGWAFQPRIDAQELITDNIFQAHSPRQWDAVTYFAPGFTLAGDLPKLQLYFQFQPTLQMHVEAGSLNSLTQQYSGTALATLVDDLAYLDVRAISGVNSVYGGLGGIGGVGANAVAGTSAANVSGLGNNNFNLNKNNQVQNSSLSISPYLLRRLGDYGNVKLGYSFNLSHSEALTGFLASPFPSGGTNQQTFISNEILAHYDTGDMFAQLQYSFDADLSQGQTTTGSQFYQTVAGVNPTGPNNYTSYNNYVTNRVSYQINPTIQVFVTGGYEYVRYTNQTYQTNNGPTWSVGTTLTPGPDALLTLSYGYNNGYYQFNGSGYYNITARTSVNASYYSSQGTQLQYLQNQLGLASGPNLVNGQNGGQLFVNTNLLGPQNGVFRFDTFQIGAQTIMNRDIISANLSITKSSQQGINAAPPSNGSSFNVQWVHELNQDMTLTTAAAYNTLSQSAVLSTINPGNSHAYIFSTALQYQLSPTLGASLRYSFFDRISEVSSNSIYQNLIVLGVSKTF
jgi:uncharacterized protein (PEP-CTERM system associated)